MHYRNLKKIDDKTFGSLQQGPMTLSIFLLAVIIIPMFWIYKDEKNKQDEE